MMKRTVFAGTMLLLAIFVCGRPSASRPAPPQAPATMREQQGDQGAFKLSVKVRMVLVDAVVRDKSGRLMESLARDDFQVFEDGVQQPIRSFSRDELPLAIALVVDSSGSVSTYISELRSIAQRALEQLKPQDEVALFSFAMSVDRLEDLTADRQQVAESISHIKAGGGTDIVDALHTAITYLAKTAPDRRRAIILVSDNQPTIHPRKTEAETIRMALETETVVYSLRTSGRNLPFPIRLPKAMLAAGDVSKITQETGGEIMDVKSAGTLDGALGAVVSRLRRRYAIGYDPPTPARGTFHTISVRLAERLGRPGWDYYVHARRGYYSTADQPSSQRRQE